MKVNNNDNRINEQK